MCQKLWKLASSRQSYCKNYLAPFFWPTLYIQHLLPNIINECLCVSMFQLPPNISYNAKWHIGLDAPEAVVINCSFHAASMYCMGWLYPGLRSSHIRRAFQVPPLINTSSLKRETTRADLGIDIARNLYRGQRAPPHQLGSLAERWKLPQWVSSHQNESRFRSNGTALWSVVRNGNGRTATECWKPGMTIANSVESCCR